MLEFRDLKKQYEIHKKDFDEAILKTLHEGNFIGGSSVKELEKQLAQYVGVKHCISCANGTDAMSLALMAWEIGLGDAVFVPDFTFFATAEAVALCGAVPVFVDVEQDTFNMDPAALEKAIRSVMKEGRLKPSVVITVDLFGLPADYTAICRITEQYHLKLLEDGAQGFGGSIDGRKACSFGDISTTSFFPAKPLGCYGDGGAIFTNDDNMAAILSSLKVHGRGADKYDNIRIGLNSRLDTIQAAILIVKLRLFQEYELEQVNKVAEWYHTYLSDMKEYIKLPDVPSKFYSSWAQFTILLRDKNMRYDVQNQLKEMQIPTMIYYQSPLHMQRAFAEIEIYSVCPVSEDICDRVLALPMHPYMKEETVVTIALSLKTILKKFDIYI